MRRRAWCARLVQPSTIGLPGTRCSPILSRCAPREVSPAFNNAIVAMCHSAGLAPTFVEVPEPAWSTCFSPWPPVSAWRCCRRRSPSGSLPRDPLRCPRGRRSRLPQRGTDPSRCGQPRDTRVPARARHDPVGVVRRHQFPAGSPSQPHDEPSRSVGGGGLIRTLARLRADGRAARHLSLSRAQASTRPTSCPGGRTRPVWLDRFFFLWSMGAEAILGGSGVL